MSGKKRFFFFNAFFALPERCLNVSRLANESFRQQSVRKRIGMIHERPIVSSQAWYIVRSLYRFGDFVIKNCV